MSALDFILEMVGVPSETVAEIEKAAPSLAALMKLAQDNDALIRELAALAAKYQPLLAQVAPLIAQAAPLIAKATPLINQAAVEIKTIMPAAHDVIAFIRKQQQQ